MLGKSANTTPHLFQPGTKVRHYTDGTKGVVVELDTNLIDMGYSSTTCTVLWEGDTSVDIQWTNKLVLEKNNDD